MGSSGVDSVNAILCYGVDTLIVRIKHVRGMVQTGLTSCDVIVYVLRMGRLVQTRNDGVDGVKSMLRYGLDGLIVRIINMSGTAQTGMMSCGVIVCVLQIGRSVRTRSDEVDSVKAMLRYGLDE